MIKAVIKDGEGSNREAGVTPDHAVKVTVLELRTTDVSAEVLTRRKIYRGFLEKDGSSNLNVDGSSTAVDFVLTSTNDFSRWITGVRLLFNGVNMEIDTNDFRRFGAATASQTSLTNGIKFFIEQGNVVTEFFIEPIKTLGQFLDYADRFTNLANSIGAQEDFISFDFDFEAPIALPPATSDRIVIRIQDDLTDIDLFKAIVRGTQEKVR